MHLVPSWEIAQGIAHYKAKGCRTSNSQALLAHSPRNHSRCEAEEPTNTVKTALPPAIADFFQAHNTGQTDDFKELFTADALSRTRRRHDCVARNGGTAKLDGKIPAGPETDSVVKQHNKNNTHEKY
jgi:hypothetical protein